MKIEILRISNELLGGFLDKTIHLKSSLCNFLIFLNQMIHRSIRTH